MKKLLSLFILSSIILIGSANTSIAQEVKHRAKAQLHVAKTKKVQRDVCKAYRNAEAGKKVRLKARPIRQKANLQVHPAKRRIEK